VLSELGDTAPPRLWRGRGCRQCQGTGYRGRTGIFEVMPITEPIRAMILERASAGEIRRIAAGQGMRGLREDGWRLVRDGRTTVEEVLRVSKDERFYGNGNGSGDLFAGNGNHGHGTSPLPAVKGSGRQ